MNDPNKVCFIIAHKYIRGYESYIQYYVDNIQKLYPESQVIIVDNNSTYKEDVLSILRGRKNVILLDNNIASKFELGAYQVGLNYVFDNNQVNDFEYFIFTQDNFVLKNRYDFNNLIEKKTYALPINSFYFDGECSDIYPGVLTRLGMYDNLDKVNFCWCSSFIVVNHKIEQLYSYLKSIVVTRRWESCASERYLARILWELNEHRDCGDIDGSAADLAIRFYDTWTVNVYDDVKSYFVKKVQQKTEHTVDSSSPQSIIHKRPSELR